MKGIQTTPVDDVRVPEDTCIGFISMIDEELGPEFKIGKELRVIEYICANPLIVKEQWEDSYGNFYPWEQLKYIDFDVAAIVFADDAAGICKVLFLIEIDIEAQFGLEESFGGRIAIFPRTNQS